MSKTKAGGCGDREVDMHLRTEYAALQLRLTNRTFVTVGMAEIIKTVGRIRASIQVRLRIDHHPHLTLRNNHGESSVVVFVVLELFSSFTSLKFLP
jgi:hypothetical protein